MKKPSPLEGIRVVHFTDERITDPLGAREELTWQEYHAARNHLLEICEKHGTAGPMGKRPLDVDEKTSHRSWHLSQNSPDFYIISDQLNSERYLYLDICSPKKVTSSWLNDIVQFDAKFPAWGIGMTNVKLGYMIILPPVLLVMGPAFASAKTGEDCVKVLQMSLDV